MIVAKIVNEQLDNKEAHLLVSLREEIDSYVCKSGEQSIPIVNGELRIPDGVTQIGKGNDGNPIGFHSEGDNSETLWDLFSETSNVKGLFKDIKKVSIPASVEKIKYGFFQKFENLKEINFAEQNALKRFFPGVFAGCSKLESVEIPEGTADLKIDVGAFLDCNQIKSISLPSNSVIAFAEDESISVLDNVEKLHIYGKVKQYNGALLKEKTNMDYDFSGVILSHFPHINQSNYYSDYTTIGNGFAFHKNLKSIRIPDGITTIGEEAFAYCKKLEYAEIPKGVDTINRAAFASCVSLKSVVMPDDVSFIGRVAFMDCKSLKNIKIPRKIKFIEEETFAFCDMLESISIPDKVTGIGKQAFYCCKALKNVKMPKKLQWIDMKAFIQCNSLKKVRLPNKNVSFWHNAFDDGVKLVYGRPTILERLKDVFLRKQQLEQNMLPPEHDEEEAKETETFEDFVESIKIAPKDKYRPQRKDINPNTQPEDPDSDR